jgi:hypothetical protein
LARFTDQAAYPSRITSSSPIATNVSAVARSFAHERHQRQGERDQRDDTEDRGPPDNPNVGPGDGGERDGGRAQQQPAQDKQHILHRYA